MTTLDEDTANDVVRAYVWKNGIDQKPTPFIYSDVKGGMYANAPYGVNGVKTIEMFNTVRVHGDLTKDAVIATSSWKNLRPVFQFVKDGALQSKAYVYWPSSGATPSLGAMTTVIPFSFPNDLNGTYLAAMHNGQYSATSEGGQFKYFSRMYVANLGATPGLNSMVDGFLFDTREGDKNGDESKGGPKGTGFAPTGMLSCTPFDTEKTILGDNDYCAFYVLLAPGADGHSVQAYMMGLNQGILAYNIPFCKF